MITNPAHSYYERTRAATLAAFSFACFAGPGLSFGKVYLVHLLAPLFVFFYLKPFSITLRKWITANIPIVVVIGFLFISLIWSSDLFAGFIYNYYWVFGFFISICFATTLRDDKTFSSLKKAFVVFVCIHLVLSLVEAFGLGRWPISQYSKYLDMFSKTISLTPRRAGVYELERSLPTSFFWNPNNSALFSLMSLPFILLLSQQIFKGILFFFTCLIIFLSGSSAAMVFTSLYISFRFISVKDLKTRLGFLVVAVLTLIFVIVLATPLQKTKISTSISRVVHFTDGSVRVMDALISGKEMNYAVIDETVRERISLLYEAGSKIKSSKGLGLGSGSLNSLQYFFEDRYLSFSSIHMYWLEVFLVGGAVCIGAYVFWLISIMKILYIFSSSYSKACLESLILFIVCSPVLSSAVYFLPMYVLYGICSGIILREKNSHV